MQARPIAAGDLYGVGLSALRRRGKVRGENDVIEGNLRALSDHWHVWLRCLSSVPQKYAFSGHNKVIWSTAGSDWHHRCGNRCDALCLESKEGAESQTGLRNLLQANTREVAHGSCGKWNREYSGDGSNDIPYGLLLDGATYRKVHWGKDP
jgi:hypothetical protein